MKILLATVSVLVVATGGHASPILDTNGAEYHDGMTRWTDIVLTVDGDAPRWEAFETGFDTDAPGDVVEMQTRLPPLHLGLDLLQNGVFWSIQPAPAISIDLEPMSVPALQGLVVTLRTHGRFDLTAELMEG